jgi:hypothetical protein
MNPVVKKIDEPFKDKGADLNGWWVFNAFRGDTYVQGIKIMLGVGEPAPDQVAFQFLIYTKDGIYPYFTLKSPDLLKVAKDTHDTKFADLCHIRGTWPKYTVYAREPKNDINVTLEFDAKTVQYWKGGAPLVFNHFGTPKTWHVYYSAYDCETKAHFEIQGKKYDYTAIGDYENLWGRNLPGINLPSLGYWFYEPLMWNDAFGSVAWQIVYGDGSVYVAEGVTTIPDGTHKHFDSCKFEVTEKFFDKATGHEVPRKWRVVLKGDFGTMEYEATGFGDIWLNMYVEAEGEYRSSDGQTLALKGKGVSEFAMDRYNPVLKRSLGPDEIVDLSRLPGFSPED